MTADELMRCKPGTKLAYIVGVGTVERRYPAVRLHDEPEAVMLAVWFAGNDRRAFKWCTLTNQPQQEWQGRLGAVRLEIRGGPSR